MPCNLAVSITKAAVTEDHLRALLTADTVSDVVLRFLAQQYARRSPRLLSASGRRSVFLMDEGDTLITITDGKVTINAVALRPSQADDILEAVSLLLTRLTDMLFQRQVQQALSARFDTCLIGAQTLEVENEGERQQAAVFTLDL
jgi:hypothetical protein